MRVAIISNGFQVNYILDLVNGLSSAGCRIELLGSSIYPVDRINNNVVFKNLRGDHDSDKPFFEKLRRNLNYYRKLLLRVNKGNTDLVHIQWLNIPVLDGIIIPLYFRITGIKCCYTVHDVLPHSRDNLLNRVLYGLIYRVPNRLIVHTEHIRKRLIEEFHLRPEVINVVQHGVYSDGQKTVISKQKARAELEFGGEDRILLFFGHITAYKGLRILLEAFEKVKTVEPKLKLIIAGRVADDYIKDFNVLTSLYKSEDITFLPEHIEDGLMHKLFCAADVTVLPYLEASQSGVMFMSYSFGRPVIVPAIGSFPDDIVESRTGFLFEKGDTASLSSAITGFFKQYDTGDEANEDFIKQYALNNYSWEKTGRDMAWIYSDVTGKNSEVTKKISQQE